MHTTRRLLVTLATSALLTGALVSGAQATPPDNYVPANASRLSDVEPRDNPACPANAFCLFEDDDFGGGIAIFYDDDRDLRNRNWEGTNRPVHNGASSMINNTGRYVTLQSNAQSCDGDRYTARPESEDRDLTDNEFDNEASCVQIN